MIFNTKEISLDAQNNITWEVEYRRNAQSKAIITQTFNFPNTMTRADMVIEIKKNSPDDETIAEEQARLAEETRLNNFLTSAKTEFLGIDKTFDPANFKEPIV